MSRPKLLLLDLPFHQHSGSTEFVPELLARKFDVTRVFLEATRDEEAACLAAVRAHAPDLLVLFQLSFTPAVLAQVEVPTVWIPMYDDSNRRFDDRFVAAARTGESLLLFSTAQAEIARYWNLPHLAVQYRPPSGPPPDFEAGNNRVLFWYRGSIQPAEIAPILLSVPDLEVVIKHDPDPPFVSLPRDDGTLAPHVVQVIEGFLPKAEYDALVASCGLYVAPRKAEGIGQSFLEAMARGSLVVAYDGPTMSEYIDHGKDGWLFSESHADPLPASDIADMRRASHVRSEAGLAAWQAAEEAILDFVEHATTPSLRSNSAWLKTHAVRAAIRIKEGRRT